MRKFKSMINYKYNLKGGEVLFYKVYYQTLITYLLRI